VALPEYLLTLPDLDLHLTLVAENLKAPGLSLRQASAKLERTERRGKLVATVTGNDFGSLDLTLEANTPSSKPADVKLTANFADMDLADVFRQKGLINNRSSGSLHFYGGQASNVACMQGGTDKSDRQQLAAAAHPAGKAVFVWKCTPAIQ
jgi:hypothetical protein